MPPQVRIQSEWFYEICNIKFAVAKLCSKGLTVPTFTETPLQCWTKQLSKVQRSSRSGHNQKTLIISAFAQLFTASITFDCKLYFCKRRLSPRLCLQTILRLSQYFLIFQFPKIVHQLVRQLVYNFFLCQISSLFLQVIIKNYFSYTMLDKIFE